MILAAYMVAGGLAARPYAVGQLRGRWDRYNRFGFVLPFTVAAIATPFQIGIGDTAARAIASRSATSPAPRPEASRLPTVASADPPMSRKRSFESHFGRDRNGATFTQLTSSRSRGAQQQAETACRWKHAGIACSTLPRMARYGYARTHPAAARAPLACPTCGREPTTRHETLQQHEDLAIIWLHLDSDRVTEARHCVVCQPHGPVIDVSCSCCGNGPLITGQPTELGDRLAAPALDGKHFRGWQLHPQPTRPQGGACKAAHTLVP